ncbi:endolytic transglycosylase MltG [Phytomonospora sp. NPDC050363]|uniref:endolytic transglycosylase MltG n=1 Tax=Phytomonospora sp. NPDC050363 TaxID=3155642 RepID=UPI0033C25D50
MSVLDDFARTGEDRPRPKSHRRKKKGRTGVTLLLVVVLLGGLVGGGWWGFGKLQDAFGAPDYQGTGTGEVEVTIPEGALLADMANELFNAGVVKSGAAFVEAAEANPDAKNIQPGTYRLRKEMSAASAIELMLSSDSRVKNGITIPEGRHTFDIYKILSEGTGVDVEDFEQAAKDTEALGIDDSWFDRKTDDEKIVKSVEGFLFPDTYDFGKDATAESMLSEMVSRFMAVAEEIDFQGTVEASFGGEVSPWEALNMASLSQAEALHDEDMGKVSRVGYNRIFDNTGGEYIGGLLEYDVTWNYGELVEGRKALASKDMNMEDLRDPDSNKWSTHAHPGLPPTPIGSPGRAALEGAASPPDGNWLFFVAVDKDGTTKFAATLAEHEANIEEAKKNGVL